MALVAIMACLLSDPQLSQCHDFKIVITPTITKKSTLTPTSRELFLNPGLGKCKRHLELRRAEYRKFEKGMVLLSILSRGAALPREWKVIKPLVRVVVNERG